MKKIIAKFTKALNPPDNEQYIACSEVIIDRINDAAEFSEFYRIPIEHLKQLVEKAGVIDVETARKLIKGAFKELNFGALSLLPIIKVDGLGREESINILSIFSGIQLFDVLADQPKNHRSERKGGLFEQVRGEYSTFNKNDEFYEIVEIKGGGEFVEKKTTLIKNVETQNKSVDVLRKLHEKNSISLCASSCMAGSVGSLISGGEEPFVTHDQELSWIRIDFKNHLVEPQEYTIKGNKKGFRQLRKWELKGYSLSGEEISLDSQKDQKFQNDNPNTYIIKCKKEVSSIKLVQTSINSFGDHCLSISSIKIYGVVRKL